MYLFYTNSLYGQLYLWQINKLLIDFYMNKILMIFFSRRKFCSIRFSSSISWINIFFVRPIDILSYQDLTILHHKAVVSLGLYWVYLGELHWYALTMLRSAVHPTIDVSQDLCNLQILTFSYSTCFLNIIYIIFK